MNQRIVVGDGPQPLTVEWVKAGQYIEAPTVGDQTEPYMVLSSCPPDLFHSAYFCETCRQSLANRGQLEMHVEKGGSHRIAMWCSRRSVYEAALPIDLDATAPQ